MEYSAGDMRSSRPHDRFRLLFRRVVFQWDYVGKLVEKDDPKLAAENSKAGREGGAD